MCRDVLKHESSGAFMFTFEESYFGEVWELKLRYFQDVEENLETRKTALNQLYALHAPSINFFQNCLQWSFKASCHTYHILKRWRTYKCEVDMILTIWSLQPHLHWKYLLISTGDYRCYVLIWWQLNAHRELRGAVTPVPVTSVSNPQTRTRRKTVRWRAN